MAQDTLDSTQDLTFKALEHKPPGFTLELPAVFAAMPWPHNGLLPVITQDHSSKQVLMLAWVNQSALLLSIQTGKAHYWSRSRNALWCKGESSGHHQAILQIQLDCDGDALLYQVEQTGQACHTNRAHCFYWSVNALGAIMTDPDVL